MIFNAAMTSIVKIHFAASVRSDKKAVTPTSNCGSNKYDKLIWTEATGVMVGNGLTDHWSNYLFVLADD